MLWWHWLVVGLALCASELVFPAFILIWLGLAALVLSLLVVFVDISLTWQLLVWTILSLSLMGIWLRVFKSSDRSTRAGTSDSAIGEIGLLVNGVMPFQEGEVLFQRPVLGSDRWKCLSETTLAAGTRVRVIAIEGGALRVASAEFRHAASSEA